MTSKLVTALTVVLISICTLISCSKDHLSDTNQVTTTPPPPPDPTRIVPTIPEDCMLKAQESMDSLFNAQIVYQTGSKMFFEYDEEISTLDSFVYRIQKILPKAKALYSFALKPFFKSLHLNITMDLIFIVHHQATGITRTYTVKLTIISDPSTNTYSDGFQ